MPCAVRIATDLGDDALLRSFASIGAGIARLVDGDAAGRGDLLAAADTGLRHRIDNLATRR